MFEKIENEFPIMNSKEILSAKGPQIKFSKEEVKMLKNYIEELLVGEKVPKMIL